jgi:hypothetical protein
VRQLGRLRGVRHPCTRLAGRAGIGCQLPGWAASWARVLMPMGTRCITDNKQPRWTNENGRQYVDSAPPVRRVRGLTRRNAARDAQALLLPLRVGDPDIIVRTGM